MLEPVNAPFVSEPFKSGTSSARGGSWTARGSSAAERMGAAVAQAGGDAITGYVLAGLPSPDKRRVLAFLESGRDSAVGDTGRVVNMAGQDSNSTRISPSSTIAE
jgi:hypothetical protein